MLEYEGRPGRKPRLVDGHMPWQLKGRLDRALLVAELLELAALTGPAEGAMLVRMALARATAPPVRALTSPAATSPF